MKGLTHFIVGIACATFFASAVRAAAFEGTMIIILGGIFGILPDFLDFRFSRFVEPHDYELEPDPSKPKASQIAEAMAHAIDEAARTGKTVRLKLHTTKVSADLWRRYSVTIDSKNRKICAQIGPLVTTGQMPIPESEPKGEDAYAECKFAPELVHTYEEETNIDIFSGPDFAFVNEDGKVRVEFIPWHRRWSHSLTVGALFTPIGILLYGVTKLGLVAACIILAGFWAHIFVDQLGVLGSNLFYPFTAKRSNGLGICHSGDALPNILTNYTAVLLVIWNLNAYSYEPQFQMPWAEWAAQNFAVPLGSVGSYLIGLANYIVYFILLPFLVVYFGHGVYKHYRRVPVITGESAIAQEALRETEEEISR